MDKIADNSFSEVYEFLVSSPSPEEILAFRPSPATQDRIRFLLQVNQERNLTPEEELELSEFDKIEHVVRMLKIYAKAKIQQR